MCAAKPITLYHRSISFSCEVGEKWITCDNLLGGGGGGGVLSYTFRVPDQRARGMNRLCSLSILTSTGSSSKTAVLNASVTKLVFPKLEEMAAEIIERTDIAPVTTDRKKSLTFIHLGFAQLLSHLCLESEEFVRFSSVLQTGQ